MTFYRDTPKFMSYFLQIMSLDRIYSVNDLGVLLDHKLKFDSHVRLPSYSSRLILIILPSLVNRRTGLDTIFMNNLIRGDIDSVDLVSRLTFNVPVRLMRNYYPINLPRCSSNFSQHEPFRVLSNNYNTLSHLNCFSTSMPILKTKILAHLL